MHEGSFGDGKRPTARIIVDRYQREEQRRQRERYESLLRVCEVATPSANLDELCFNAATALAYEFDADNTSIFLCSPDGLKIVEQVWFKRKRFGEWKTAMSYSVNAGRMGELNLNRAVIEMDLSNPHPEDEDMSFLGSEYVYLVSVPLFSRSDLVGVYSLHYKRERRFSSAERDLMIALGGLLGSLVKQTKTVANARDNEMHAAYKRLSESTSEGLARISKALGAQAASAGAEPRGFPSPCEHPPSPNPSPARALTGREVQVLTLLAEGCSNDEIAHALYVSEITIKKQVSAILRKLGLRNRVQLAVYAAKAGLVD